jgi:hypothetical protein
VIKSIARGLTVGTKVAGGTIIVCAERKETSVPKSPSAKRQSAVMFLVRTYALWHRSKAALIIILVNFTVRMHNHDSSRCHLLCLQSQVVFIPVLAIRVLFNSAVTSE